MAYVVASEITPSDGATASFAVDLPAGHQAGDLLLAIVTQDGGGTTIAAPGWTLVGTSTASGVQRTVALRKLAASSAEPEFAATGAVDEWLVTVLVVRAADASAPINAVLVSNVSGATPASGSLTTTADNCLLIYAWGYDGAPRLVPQNANELVFLTKEIHTICQIVGYRNQLAAGAAPSVTALSEVATEGGQALVIAIADATPATPQLAPECAEGPVVVKRYGGLTTASTTSAAFIRHDGITWEPPSTLSAASIQGIGLTATAPAQEGVFSAAAGWGSFTAVGHSMATGPGDGIWTGATHAMGAVDMAGGVFCLTFMFSHNDAVNLGVFGAAVVFQDSVGNWSAYTLSPRSGARALVPYVAVIDLANAAPLAASAAPIDWSDVVRLGYLMHRAANSSTSGREIAVKNALLLRRSTLLGGCAAAPVTPALLDTFLQGWGAVGLTGLQGSGQALLRSSVRYGNGTRATYVNTSGTSTEFPVGATPSILRRFWQVSPDAVEVRIHASAQDVVQIPACLLVTSTRQGFVIDAASSPLALYNFAGTSFIGWSVLNAAAGVAINGASFKECHGIVLAGGALTDCAVSGSLASPAVTTPDASQVVRTAFTSGGSGHALEITAPGTYTFSGNTFSGYGAAGSTNAAIYNNSGGLVVLSISGGGDTPTVRNGAGATTTVLSGATLTLASDTDLTGAEIRIYDLDDTAPGSLGTELAGVESSPAATFTYAYSDPGNLVWLQVMKAGFEEYGQRYTLTATDSTLSLTLTPELND